MRTLFLDACAIRKYFLPEKGSEVMHWLCSKRALLCGVRCISSPEVRQEFFHLIDEKHQFGLIPRDQADRIKSTASDLFEGLILRNGRSSLQGMPGRDVTADELAERYKTTVGKYNWDMDRIEMIASNLHFLAGAQRIQVVTSDEGFGEVLEREGYDIINPEAKNIGDLLEEWATENKASIL